MSEGDGRTRHVDEVMDCARAVETAIHRLCRASGSRPRMTPADVSAVLADLAAATAALPQIATQLGDILTQARHDYRLEMDAMAPDQDPARALANTRLRLDAIRGPASEVYRLLDAAHNQTAHIAAADRPVLLVRADQPGLRTGWRPENRPPPRVCDDRGPSIPR